MKFSTCQRYCLNISFVSTSLFVFSVVFKIVYLLSQKQHPGLQSSSSMNAFCDKRHSAPSHFGSISMSIVIGIQGKKSVLLTVLLRKTKTVTLETTQA